MLRAAIVLFVIGIVAMLLGVWNVAGVSFELGRLLLFIFAGLAIVGFIASLVTGRRTPGPAL
jgi:uncharacterized membrane protein YtjA (UPF0391 family)